MIVLDARTPQVGDYRIQHGHSASLVQRFVAIPALWRLNTGRASGRALAGGYGLPRCGQPWDERGEAAVGETGSPRMTIVHKHRRLPGVYVQRGGNPADVPSVTGREQRKQADRRVLGSMQGAGDARWSQTSAPRCPASVGR